MMETNWLEYVNEKICADQTLSSFFSADSEPAQALADSLALVFEGRSEPLLVSFLQSQWAILVRLTHYADFLQKVQLPQEDLQLIQYQQLMLSALHNLASQRYQELFGAAVELPDSVQRSPGFIRFLREDCGLQFVLHYVGFSLRTFISESWKDDAVRLEDETYFRGSLEFIVDLLLDTKERDELLETIQKQGDELVWLTEEISLKKVELAQEPDNERFKEELDVLEDDLRIETLERDYLLQVIEPVF